jgi:ABC-type Mn2+/Zn2+ transport system permease subunit
MINVGTIIDASIFSVPASIALLFTASFPTTLVWIAGSASLPLSCAAMLVLRRREPGPPRPSGPGAIR